MADKLTQFDFDGELALLPDEDHRDQAKASFDLGESEPETYLGPEHRLAHRRQQGDRRRLVRFEDKPDRRGGEDRRKGTWGDRYSI